MSDYIRKADAIDDLHTQLMYRMGSDDMKRRLDDFINVARFHTVRNFLKMERTEEEE